MDKKIVLLADNSLSTNIVFNQLITSLTIEKIIMEQKQSAWFLAKKRAKRLGWLTVFGQMIFVVFSKGLQKTSKLRIEEIKQQFNLNPSQPPQEIIIRVNSINDQKTISLLQSLAPDIVIVNGTRILSKALLGCINAVFINMHAGITPAYRGGHGGYWALANHDSGNCGVTIHLIDPGIDTGEILYQSVIQPIAPDNFVTYPLLQLAAGIPLLMRAVKDVQLGQLTIQKSNSPSKLWSHPTLWQYFYYWLRFRVK